MYCLIAIILSPLDPADLQFDRFAAFQASRSCGQIVFTSHPLRSYNVPDYIIRHLLQDEGDIAGSECDMEFFQQQLFGALPQSLGQLTHPFASPLYCTAFAGIGYGFPVHSRATWSSEISNNGAQHACRQ